MGFIVYPSHRLLKRRNAVNLPRKLVHSVDLYESGAIPFAELDASVQGWINHVRAASLQPSRYMGLAQAFFDTHPITLHPEPQLPVEYLCATHLQ